MHALRPCCSNAHWTGVCRRQLDRLRLEKEHKAAAAAAAMAATRAANAAFLEAKKAAQKQQEILDAQLMQETIR